MREKVNPVLRRIISKEEKAEVRRSPTGGSGYIPGQGSFSGFPESGFGQPQYGQPQYGQPPYGEPVFPDSGFGQAGEGQSIFPRGQSRLAPSIAGPMTVDDVVTKTGITLGTIVLAAALTFGLVGYGVIGAGAPMAIGCIGGLIMVLISTWGNKGGSALVTLLYAVFEGLALGSLTFLLSNIEIAGGISVGWLVFDAIAGTLGVFLGMLVVYKTGAIRVTPRFTRIIVACIFGILVLALINLVGALFGFNIGIRGNGIVAIFFSLFCIVIASLSFLIDFDGADRLIRDGAPAQLAWGVALGLAVTLVWLYIEILNLLITLFASGDRR